MLPLLVAEKNMKRSLNEGVRSQKESLDVWSILLRGSFIYRRRPK
jgi:hypothetical protein